MQSLAQVRPDYLTLTGIFSVHDAVRQVAFGLDLLTTQLDVIDTERGLLGWDRAYRIALGEQVLAVYATGGEAMRGKSRLELQGTYCSACQHWDYWGNWMRTVPGVKITRVDLCADLLGGEIGVEAAVQHWRNGGFTCGGRPPSLHLHGPWVEDDGSGRTVYVGARASGKMWRIYEKGRQLGDKASPWVRWEVELRAEQREIPVDVLFEPAAYFAGQAPIAGWIAQVAAQAIRAIRRGATIRLEHIVQHARRAYGHVVDYLDRMGVGTVEIVAALRRPSGRPRAWMVDELLDRLDAEDVCRQIAAVPF